ncbi:unnamed protein product [Lathyrus oleraceus]|uniref:Uncharacterized protein n=1 Tax=Pisum sativum TaxID=3888 RepID=A0A9D4WUE3_PEA|nr:uncharacterized protein LOC127088208 [Pisum sativum]KAI5407868.1 hypothetical protein KIW84_053925 [Pisum sativum]
MAMLSSEEKKNTNDNGVIIKYYVESVKIRSMKKTKPNEYLRNEEKHGYEYDRRANLLAHSRYLRNPASETVSLPVIQPRPKPKSKFISYQPVRICSCSASMETVPSLTIRSRNELKEKKEDNLSEKRKFNEKYSPKILGKMNNLWKQLSCKEI